MNRYKKFVMKDWRNEETKNKAGRIAEIKQNHYEKRS